MPIVLLRKRYGQAVLGEVLEEAVKHAAQRTMAERELRPVAQPKIEIENFEDGADLAYTMAVELMPDIPTVDLSAISLERIVVEPDEEKVQDALDNLARAHGTSEPVAEAREARSGDIVVIDFDGRVDGEAFPGGTAEGYFLELGSGRFVPGFDDQLTGVRAGEDRTVEVTFPDDYPASELAGKSARFAVSVKELRAPKVAAVDDGLAKKMGLETLDDLRRAVHENQEREYRSLARARLKRDLLDALADGQRFETPPGMVDTEFQAIWKQVEERREAVARGVASAADEDPEDAEKSVEELKAEYRDIAERRVRLGLLLAEIGRINNVQVGQEALNRAMTDEARRYPGREREVFEKLKASPEAQEALRAPVFEEKVVDFILEMATVAERRITADQFAELMREDARAGADAGDAGDAG